LNGIDNAGEQEQALPSAEESKMDRTRLLVIGIVALVLSAALSYVVYQRLQAKMAPQRVGVDVVVAANDIQIGAKIADRDLKVVKYPPDDLPPRVFHSKTSALGRGTVLPIGKGEFVVPDRLAAENAGAGLSTLIAVGMRAEAVRVNDVTAVAGFVVPGTRVDVLVTGNPTGSGEPQTTTVLQDVTVLATGQRTERSATGEPQNASVVTLSVSPEDSEKLALASQEGRIQLVLRNPLDTNQQKAPAIRNRSLFDGAMSAPHSAKVIRVKQAPTQAPEPEKLEIDIIRGNQKETIHLKQ
jgi:pilus assembly protein CpaB